MRLEKRKSNNISGMENHNERKTDNHSNCNIDLEKRDLNYDLVQCDNYRKKIDEEINKRYSGKKAIRKDAVLCTEFLFTSDNKFFSDIGEERERIYFEKSLEFLENKFGKENIISAKVHKDEETPHLHAVIVPLHSDGSLSMKKYIDTKYDLSKLQDEYFNHISKEFLELDRGLSATETNRKNIPLNEFKKQTSYLEKKIKDLEKDISLKNKEIDKLNKNIKSRQQYKECLETVSVIEGNATKKLFSKKVSIDKDQFETVISFAKNYVSEKEEISKLEKKNEIYTRKIKELRNEIISVETKNNSLERKLNKEIDKKLDRDIIFSSMEKKVEDVKEYINILEKTLIEKAPEILDESQRKFLENKFPFERKEFIKEKKENNTLSSELMLKEKMNRKKQKSLGMEM